MAEPLRLRCVLGKFRCVAVERLIAGWRATVQVGDGYRMHILMPEFADIRVGDLLTLYTEVPAKENLGALPLRTPEQ